MITDSGSWARLALCLLLACAQLVPAVSARGAVVQVRVVPARSVPGSFALPVLALPQVRLAGGSLSVPTLSGSLLAAAAPSLGAGPGLAAPLAALAPRTASLSAAAPEVSPATLAEGLAQTGSIITAQPERGGARTGAVLDELFSGKTRRAAAPEAVAAAPESGGASSGLSRPQPNRSSRIAETTDESGRRIFLVGVSDLLREADAGPRSALSLSIAREALAALGEAAPDGSRAAALADFLRDIAAYRLEGAASVGLEMDGRNHFRLVFARGDGSRKFLLGEFLPEGFVLMGPAEVSADGKVSQEHRGYWREYSGGGGRREWRAAARSEKRGWGPWAYEAGLRDAALTEQSWREGAWQDGESRLVKTVETVGKRSWLGRAGDRLFRAPVLGPLLRFCDRFAETVFSGSAVLPRLFGQVLGGPGRAGLETGGNLAKNPLLRAVKGDRWAVERLGPPAREKLESRVRQVRTEALAEMLFPVSPEAARRFVGADIGPEESAAVLRGHWGVGTFGRRLIRMGAGTRGWKKFGLVAAGVAVGAVEGAAESVCNPILWAMLGLETAAAAAEAAAAVAAPAWKPAVLAGEGAGLLGLGLLFNEAMAVTRGAAVSARTAGLMAGIWSLRAAHITATALWWGPWLFSATDNVGRMVQLTAEGDFDKDYFKQMSKLGTDALYYFVIP
jgi:hypothetical protein